MNDLFDKRFLDEMLSLSQKAVNILSEIKKKKKEREQFKASHTSAIEDENDEYEGVSSKELKHIIRFWKKSNQSNYENWKEANYELRKLKNQISPASSAIEEREGRDWEIVTLISTKNQSKISDQSNIMAWMEGSRIGWDIYSVRRKSDGVVFTVNDRVEDKLVMGEKNIKFFKIMDGMMYAGFDGHGRCINDIKHIQPLPQRTKLFDTIDGKDIFEGDIYWFVSSADFSMAQSLPASHSESNDHWKTFSTEAAAKEYITLNKPVLSVNEAKEVWAKDGYFPKEIERLAKKKLNIDQ